MTIKGIGIDIEDVARFRARPYSKNQAFYKKIFSKKEIAYCLQSPSPAERFAARFAAKEACIKAIGGRDRQVRAVSDVEVVMKRGRPEIHMRKYSAHVSLSHTRDLAAACVVVCRN